MLDNKAFAQRALTWRAFLVVAMMLLTVQTSLAAPPQPVVDAIDLTGMAPFTVHVNALDSSFGAGNELTARFEWDFGDDESPFNTLEGWNAAHQYRQAGTYTITLRVTNENGEVGVATTNVVVSPNTRSAIFVAATGSDQNSGSMGAPIRSAREAFKRLGHDTNVFFRRGDTFDVPTSMSLSSSNVLFSAYGNGAKPVLRWTGGMGTSAIVKTSLDNHSDMVFENLTFTSIYNADAQRDVVDGLVPAGVNFTVRDCAFGELSLALNNNRQPIGLLLQGCDAGELGAYLSWGQGSDHTYIGNSVDGSHFEHNIRLATVTRVLIAHNDLRNTPKRTIWSMLGKYVYITDNITRDGRITVGPNPADQGQTLNSNWVVVQRNQCTKIGGNGTVELLGGAEHIVVRNNVIEGNGTPCVAMSGTQSSTGRTTRDVRILNNTGTNTSTLGRFLSVGSGSDDLVLQNNLYVSPNLRTGASQTAIVYVLANSLNGFDDIRRNVWAIPDDFLWIDDGYHYVWPNWSNASGYKSPAQWESYGVVSNEAYETVVIDDEYAPPASSTAATHARPIAGVHTDLFGRERPGSGPWSAGAVELNAADVGNDPTGACCLTDGACIGNQTSAACIALGGAYQGNATSCATVNCPEPPPATGACCLPDGACVGNQTIDACEALGGSYEGDNTSCDLVNCPEPPPSSGACCLPDGSCVGNQTRAACSVFGGEYEGDNTSCGTANCPQPPPATGACCLPDGSCVSNQTSAACTALGGSYEGNNSSCATANCPEPPPASGACCLLNGTCETVASAATCASSGGLFMGNGTTCASVSCPQSGGGCCTAGGSCLNGQTESDCASLGGIFLGVGVSCANVSCPLAAGACCFPSGNCILAQSPSSCVVEGGEFQGPGTSCAVMPCEMPVGACCFNDGACLDEITSAQCASASGIYQGNGTTCAAVNCPEPAPMMGACCLDDGGCVPNATVEECNILGGEYAGDDVTCAAAACPVPVLIGACCLADGSCEADRTTNECVLLGGAYQGDESSCATTSCPQPPPTGACCFPDGSCANNAPPADCSFFGGLYAGDDVMCDVAGCMQPPAIGACCLDDGSCLANRTGDECSVLGGSYAGDDASCVSANCPQPEPVGACCLVDASCLDALAIEDCLTFGGLYQGDDVSCGILSCPLPDGACCLTDGSCFVTAGDAICMIAGGEFAGNNTACDVVMCEGPVDPPFADDFENDLGWTVDNGLLLDGLWNRGLPQGGGFRGDPATDADGSGNCYVTANRFGNADVDGGPVILTSPIFNAADGPHPQIEYAAWFSNSEPDGDHLLVELSNDGGATWTELERIGRTFGWVTRRRTIEPVMQPTSMMRVRFSTSDSPNDSITEAGIDAIRVVYNATQPGADSAAPAVDPTPTPPPAPRIDGTIVFEDHFDEHNGWTVQNAATGGIWQRGIPAASGLYGDPPTDASGSGAAYVTGNSAGPSDVDGGPTRLTSPTIDLSETTDATLYVATWLVSEFDASDVLHIEVSSDDGASWVLARTVDDTVGWEVVSLRFEDYIPVTAHVRVRFSISDLFNNSTTEAGVDSFIVTVSEISPPPPPPAIGTLDDDFEYDLGWMTVTPAGAEGFWERGVPLGDGSRGDPTIDYDGSGSCYLTENRPGNSDVDGGPLDLISPRLDLTQGVNPIISFAAWFANDDFDSDRLDVAISNDDGDTWVLVERIGNTFGWEIHVFNVPDFVEPTESVRLRFRVADLPNNSITEAAVDAVQVIYNTLIPPPPPPPAPGFSDDFSGDEGWDVLNFDLADGAWERGMPYGDGSKGDPTSDFDGSGTCYLTANRPGNSDVDGGPTRLISPLLDALAGANPTIRVAIWAANDEADASDVLRVMISNNGGFDYVTVAEFVDTDGWLPLEFNVADYVTPTETIRVAFEISDAPNNSIVEAAVDDFALIFGTQLQLDAMPFIDDMELDRGWTTMVSVEGSMGAWERAIPSGDALRGDPPFDLDGSGYCFVTADGPGDTDVDGGPVALISPIMNAVAGEHAMISYGVWFANDTADEDRLTVEVSGDAGATWALVEAVEQTDGWQRHGFHIADFIEPTSAVRLRFSVSDAPNDSITEAAIDSVTLTFAGHTFPLDPLIMEQLTVTGTTWSMQVIPYPVFIKPNGQQGASLPEDTSESGTEPSVADSILDGGSDDDPDDHG
ncbi:MAG: PKD domain-containing protein, partial [Planctomycetota bacterium]